MRDFAHGVSWVWPTVGVIVLRSGNLRKSEGRAEAVAYDVGYASASRFPLMLRVEEEHSGTLAKP